VIKRSSYPQPCYWQNFIPITHIINIYTSS